jgi:amidase
VSTFISRLDGAGGGPRLAVKDVIDVAGVPTTLGSRVVAERAGPAPVDAALLRGARAAGAAIVGKTTLHELSFGTSGVNRWFGTPVNPLHRGRVPGGSSSGSAVAVATGEADVAFGTDAAGSVRIPSACCGTAALKTTHGRVPLDGVWHYSASLDTVGPMAPDVDGLVLGMELLEPGFAVAAEAPAVVGRVRGLGADPVVDAAVDRALAGAEVDAEDVEVEGWWAAYGAGLTILLAEGWRHHGGLVRRCADRIDPAVVANVERGAAITGRDVALARRVQARWRCHVATLFRRVEVLALPTLFGSPPAVGTEGPMIPATLPINLAGLPALVLPVPIPGRGAPASIQLVGPAGSEEQLLAVGRHVEAAVH